MKTGLIIFLAMFVLAADTMAGGYTEINCDNPYVNRETFNACTQGGIVYDNGQNYDDGQQYDDSQNYDDGGQVYEEPNYGNGDYDDGQQYDDGGQYYEEPNYVENRYTRVYTEYYDQCDPRGNPHSYACAKATFSGSLAGTNPRAKDDFKLLDISLKQLRGDWVMVTYANPSGNVGDEFFMVVNSARATQPLGVYNSGTSPQLENEISVWIDREGFSFNNWQGQQITTTSVEVVNKKTVVLKMQEGNYEHQFTCRDFSRTKKHHLFCAWDVLVPSQGWVHHGYMGFLSRANWNDFLTNGVR